MPNPTEPRPKLTWAEWTRPRTEAELKAVPKLTRQQSEAAVAAGRAAAEAYDASVGHLARPISNLRYV